MTRYSRNEDALVFPLFTHVRPSTFGYGEYMWGVLVSPLATILLDDGIGVKGETCVRVNGDQEKPRVGL
jgi:hypothetical protein